jgi:hypothetical protein
MFSWDDVFLRLWQCGNVVMHIAITIVIVIGEGLYKTYMLLYNCITICYNYITIYTITALNQYCRNLKTHANAYLVCLSFKLG